MAYWDEAALLIPGLVASAAGHTEHEAHIGDPEALAAQSIEADVDRIIARLNTIANIVRNGGTEEDYEQLRIAAGVTMDSLFIRLDNHLVEHVGELNAASLDVQENIQSSTVVIQVALVAAVILGGVVSYLIWRSILNPMKMIEEGARKLAKHEYATRIDIPTQDELGHLARVFNEMAQSSADYVQDLETARREAENANRMKDLFMATMSHELRTPLNAMISFLYLMVHSGQLNEDNTHMATRSLANSQRLLTLINNILDLSRIATGGVTIVASPMQLRYVASGLYNDLKMRAQEKGITLEWEVDPTIPDTITHDVDRITQVVTNLVDNAIKFTEKGTVRATFERRDDKLAIIVADSGIGIAPSKKQLIFDDFFQVDPSSKRKYQGAGLGLAIVRRLTLLMGGSIDLASVVDHGSTFTVELPLNLPMPEPIAEKERSGVFARPDLSKFAKAKA
jgi:signal transduction histidine kinase